MDPHVCPCCSRVFLKRVKNGTCVRVGPTLCEFRFGIVLDCKMSRVNGGPRLFFFTSVVMCVRNVCA